MALTVCAAALAVGTVGAIAVPALWASPDRPSAHTKPFDAAAVTRLASEPGVSATPTPSPTSVVSQTSSDHPAAPTKHRTPSSPRRTPGAGHQRPASTLRGHGPGPVSIRISSVDIAAPVVPVGVDSAGDVAIPERVDTVGWYRYAALPGDPAGSTVLVGHVDSAVQGTGSFFRLHTIDKDARVTLTMPSGKLLQYRVVARAEYPKTAVPLAALFARTGTARLTLITCGGSFDAEARSYRDNIVVTALPVG